MTKKLVKVTAALGLVVLAAGAQAQNMYGEVGYSALTYKEPGLKLSPDMVRGTLGYQFSPNLSAEGILGLGASTDTGAGGSLKVDNMVGAFVKGQYYLSDALAIHGRLGATRTKLKINGASDSGSSFAYGAGVSYDVNKSVYVSADYTNYYDRDNQKIDGYTVGLGYRF